MIHTSTAPSAQTNDNFIHVRDTSLPEYRGTGRLFRHARTGCEVYHLSNDDPENTFSFIFKTVPTDSTGVAHILEHTVLCGSERFPVKDPFLLLLKGSMYTFLNALTFPDKTVYPASSTVSADLFNLMKVYGDAVFFPLLKEEMFRQEGHRLVLTDDSELQYSGIVYNEMKGAYSTHDAIAGEMSIRSVFPDTAYGFDSGGRPADIPDLTYEQFLDFHRTHYHPSNARIFLYGDIPTEEHLAFLHDEFLSRFEPLDRPIEVGLQTAWSAPRVEFAKYPTDQERVAGQSSVTVNWLLPESARPGALIECSALADILLGGSGSPLYIALVESGLGEDLSAPTGIETELRQIVFSVGLRGTDPEKREQIETLIFDTLSALRDNGIDPDVIEGTLRKMEFSNRERPGVGFGLRLMRRAARGWLHGEEPESTLRFSEPFQALRKTLETNPRHFEQLIDRYLLQNTHRSTLVVEPDPELARIDEESVRQKLKTVYESLDEHGLQAIAEQNRRLELLQREPDTPEAAASVPFLSVTDVPGQVETIPREMRELPMGSPLLAHSIETGGIVYIDLAFDLSGIDSELLIYAPFLAGAIGDIGVPGISYDEVARRLDLTTGGFSCGVDVDQPLGSVHPIPYFYVRLKALAETVDEGSALAFECLRHPDFGDSRRLHDLFLEARNELKSSVLPSGSAFARLSAAARLSPGEALSNRFRGIEQLSFMTALNIESGSEKLAGKLEQLRAQVFSASRIKASVSAESGDVEHAERIVSDFATSLPVGASPSPTDVSALGGPEISGFGVPGGVGYVARVIPASRLGDSGYVHESILSHLLRTGYLWERIRMEGGAYGAFAVSSATEGLFSFASYRDPRIVETYRAFEEGLRHYADTPPDDRDIELAIIGLVGKELRPYSPAEKNMIDLRRYLLNVTDELRQQKRDELRSTLPEDVQSAAGRLLSAIGHGAGCVIAGKEKIEATRSQLPGLGPEILELPV